MLTKNPELESLSMAFLAPEKREHLKGAPYAGCIAVFLAPDTAFGRMSAHQVFPK